MVENSMRGGMATISHRHAVANNPLVEGYYPAKLHSWIQYLDANNLYGCSMSEPLPVGQFRFLEQHEIDNFDSAKLQANATFGKTMEQVRNRVNIRLIADPKKLAKAVSRPTFRQAELINDDLTMVRGARQRVTLNKPISVGFAILDISKSIMYQFYYDYLKPKYGYNCTLLLTDTDYFCCHIQTDDMYGDMGENASLFDTSNLDPTHPLYSKTNHRVLGKCKSETGSVASREFVGLRAKMYSLHVPADKKQSKIRVKGIKKSHVKKNVCHKHFLNTL